MKYKRIYTEFERLIDLVDEQGQKLFPENISSESKEESKEQFLVDANSIILDILGQIGFSRRFLYPLKRKFKKKKPISN